ncbi:MAG: endonuclease/exonuclease/phosphatase family protein [Clostridia bacterium]|nr:endonuclease/exonuclease/phosphatase family protein [Clostridia bacterium]
MMKLLAMTYNIASGNNLARVRNLKFAASVINQVQPDFVTVNEVRCNTSDVSLHQADELGRLTGYYPVFGKSIDISGGEYGNAFLTRCPLLEREVIHIPDRTSDERAYFEHRTVLRCVVEAKGRKITVLGTHFGLARVEQESAVETVLALLEKETNPVILMGDLNMTPDHPVIQPLFKALHDTANCKDEIKTFPSDEPNGKIDYIMHSGEFETADVYSMDTQCSDHRPLMAELSMN